MCELRPAMGVSLRHVDDTWITGSLEFCGAWDFCIQRLDGMFFADFWCRNDFSNDHVWCYRRHLLDVFKEMADFGGYLEG